MYTDYTDEDTSEYSDDYSDNGNNNNIDKEKIKKIAFFVLALVVIVVLIIIFAKSCSNKKNNSNVVDNSQTPSININYESYSVEVGEEVTLYADIMAASSNTPIAGWQTEDSNVATVEDLGENSALVKGITEGSTNIVAIYRENGRLYKNKCLITVTSKEIKLEKIDIVQEDITIAKGKELLLQIKAVPSDAKIPNLIYTSDDPSVVSVSEEGKVNALSLGTTTVTVKTEDETLSDSVKITVTGNGQTVINPTGLQLLGLSNGLKVGGTATIEPRVLPDNATNKTLTWSSTNPSVATVNSNGVITGVSAGKTTIVASTSNGISSSLEITVESDTVPVTGVTINDGTAINMTVGGTKLLSYTVSPSNATNKKVLFTTSNRNIVTVDSNGIVGARMAGTAIITITTEDGRKTATIKITVTGTGNITGSQTSNSGTGSSSSSGTGGSSSSDDVSCTDSLMTYITHNGKGAVISQYSFGQAKAFQNMSEKPVITITQIADCINLNRLTYKVYYGTTSTNVSSSVNGGSGSIKKVGDKITLNNGDGYYKIQLIGYLKNSSAVDFTKTYYAIVQNNGTDTIKPYINSISASRTSTTRLAITTSINETGSGVKNVKYCLSKSTITTCTPNLTLNNFTTYQKSANLSRTYYITNASLSSYKKVCVNATDGANNTSTYKCVNF